MSGFTRVTDPARLRALHNTELLDTAPEHAFDRLTSMAAAVLGCPTALVSLVDSDRQFFKSCFGLREPLATERQTPLAYSFCRYAVDADGPLVVNDAEAHPVTRNNPAIAKYDVRAYLGIPLRTADNSVLGTLCVLDHRAREWHERDVRLLEGLAASVMTEIELRNEIRLRAATAEGFQREIEERRRTEAELRESRRVLTTLLGHLPGMAYRCRNDQHWTLEMVSEGSAALTGYAADDLVGNRVVAYADVIHPDDRARVWEETQAKVERRQPFELLYRIVRRDGAVRTVHEDGRGIHDDDGTLVALEGFITDITEQRNAERALRDSEERYRTLLRHFPDGAVFLMDQDRRFLLADGQSLIAAGFDPAAIAGQRLCDLLPPEQAEYLEPFYLAALAGQERAFTFEHAGRIHDCKAVPVRDNAGRVIAGMVLAHDITAQRQSEAARAALEEQLRQAQKMDAIGRLAGGVAHDFNNLLTVIKASAEFLGEDLGGHASCRQDVEQIRNAAERAAGLTRQLLAFSRKQILSPRPLDLNEVVTAMRPMLARLIGEDVAIDTGLHGELHPVLADQGQIEQVIMNLVLNARDAMPLGGIITVGTANVKVGGPSSSKPEYGEQPGVLAGEYVLLEVTDTGVGIAPEVQERIFEPFFSTKEEGRGTGLGLSTVYGIVTQSGGHISVCSGVGRGTTFRIHLPRAAEAWGSCTAEPRATAPSTGSETILLVEDEDALRTLAARILTRQGYAVLQARHGADALAMADSHEGPIHLLLTDVVMPQMGGRELAERVHARRPGTPVLYMSGYTDDEIFRRGVLVSTTAFVQKPFSPSVLLGAVRESLDAASSATSSPNFPEPQLA